MQMKIKFMYENNCLLVIFCGWIESQKLKTQKLKCYVLGLKSQKFPTAENTHYTVYECIQKYYGMSHYVKQGHVLLYNPLVNYK